MPTVYTGNARMVMGLGYKKGKEEKRRYDQEFEEDVKNNKASRSSASYSASMDAYKSYLTSKVKHAKEKKLLKDTDKDGLGEYTADQLSSSSVRSGNVYDSKATKDAYENPSDEANAEAYKNSLFNVKRKYAESKLKYKVK